MPPTTHEHTRYTRLIPPRQSTYPPAWTLHRKARSSNFSMRTGTYLHGVEPTCQAFPRNLPSTFSNYSQTLIQSSNWHDAYPDRSEPQSKPKSTAYSQQALSERSRNYNGWPTHICREEEHIYLSDMRGFYNTQQMLSKGSLSTTSNRPDHRLHCWVRSTRSGWRKRTKKIRHS